jgi:hypothetical protein
MKTKDLEKTRDRLLRDLEKETDPKERALMAHAITILNGIIKRKGGQ